MRNAIVALELNLEETCDKDPQFGVARHLYDLAETLALWGSRLQNSNPYPTRPTCPPTSQLEWSLV